MRGAAFEVDDARCFEDSCRRRAHKQASVFDLGSGAEDPDTQMLPVMVRVAGYCCYPNDPLCCAAAGES
jgi:hypothetical protein